jgi:hypothetical protein
MKYIEKITKYWLFKKTSDVGEYFYIRSITQGLEDRIVWFIGKENIFGSVSGVGGELKEDIQKQLENEYQQYIKK